MQICTVYEHDYKMARKDNEVKLISRDREEKDLEIVFEEKLKFNTYITTTVNKANKLLGMKKKNIYIH